MLDELVFTGYRHVATGLGLFNQTHRGDLLVIIKVDLKNLNTTSILSLVEVTISISMHYADISAV